MHGSANKTDVTSDGGWIFIRSAVHRSVRHTPTSLHHLVAAATHARICATRRHRAALLVRRWHVRLRRPRRGADRTTSSRSISSGIAETRNRRPAPDPRTCSSALSMPAAAVPPQRRALQEPVRIKVNYSCTEPSFEKGQIINLHTRSKIYANQIIFTP